jgi:hypothetical protein
MYGVAQSIHFHTALRCSLNIANLPQMTTRSNAPASSEAKNLLNTPTPGGAWSDEATKQERGRSSFRWVINSCHESTILSRKGIILKG